MTYQRTGGGSSSGGGGGDDGDLATVATTGNYSDLINKPTIPVFDIEDNGDGTITISDE